MRQPTMLRRLPWLAATAALTLLCVPRDQARADEKSDLIYKIEGRLRGAASALASLPSESSESPIDRAGDQVREAHGYADQLKQVAGDDSDARRIAENFRDIEDDWNDAAKQLRQLKGGQRRAEPVATACTTRDEELKRKANDYGRANDPDGLTELPRLAATAQDATRRELDELRSHDGRMDDYADDADDFRGDGPWRDLASATAAAAQQTYAVWRKSWEATQATCNNLTLGVEHPTVKQVLSDLSNSAGGRKAVIEQLNRDARDLGSALAGVSEDSGMGSVERAKSLLQAIERGIETLGRTATTDRETKVIVEKWPEGVRQLKEALDDLEDLKVHQHDMDPLPEKCQLKERELKDAIARNGDDADGIDELPKLAEQMAEPVRAGLAKADERMREEEGDRDRAKAVSVSEGPWSEIRAAEQRDADETFRTYEDGYKKTKDACADVVKGKDGEIVNKELERLRRRAGETGDALDRDVATWVEEARRTYILDCTKAEELWQAHCETDFEPGDEGADGAIAQTAARLQDEMQRQMQPLLDRLKDLKPRVEALTKKRETRARGTTLLGMLTKEEDRLERLKKEEAAWVGNNSLALQFSNMYGNAHHAQEWSSMGCQVPTTSTSFANFPDATYKKPDCIIAKQGQCEIWEFKPKGDKGAREGSKQLADYARYVPAYYTDKHRRDEAPSDANGGRAFLEELRKYCLDKDSNEIAFRKVEIRSYDRCVKQYVCEPR